MDPRPQSILSIYLSNLYHMREQHCVAYFRAVAHNIIVGPINVLFHRVIFQWQQNYFLMLPKLYRERVLMFRPSYRALNSRTEDTEVQ